MSKKAVLIPSIIGLIIPAGIAVFFVFRGEICAMTWSGKDTLRCDSKLTIKNKRVTLDKHIIYAQPKCRLTLINVEFDAPTPIYLNSGARVTLRNSRLKGRRHAIYVGSGAELFVEKSTIESEKTAIYVGTGGRVVMTGGTLKGGDQSIYAGTDADVTFKGTVLTGEIYTSSRAQVKGAVITELKKRWYCRGKTEATLKGVRLSGHSTALSVQDQCRLRLVNTHLGASFVALSVQDKARLIMEGGSLKGRYAIRARGGVVVQLKGVDIDGKIDRRDGAVITRDGKTDDGRKLANKDIDVAAAEAKINADKLKRYRGVACDSVIDCYREHKYVGRIRGKLTVTVDADGKSRRVKLRARRAPRKVRACIRKLGKSRRIPRFEGPEGDLVCTWSGRLGGGFVMLSRNTDYIPAKSAKPRKGSTRKKSGAKDRLGLPDAR